MTTPDESEDNRRTDDRQAIAELRAQIQSLQQEQTRLDAALRARSARDEDKLNADIEKSGLDARKLRAELDPRAERHEKGIGELEKLQAETRKLESELDPRRHRYEKGIAEIEKLEAEKSRLTLESDPRGHNYEKGIRDLDKLDAETRKLRSDRFAEWFKTGGTLFLAAAALLTWRAASDKNEQERDARYRADAAHLIESLGVPQAPQLRAAAAIGLRTFIDDARTRPLVLGSLAYSMGIETHVDVQNAMAESLVAAGPDAVPLLRQMISRVNGGVQIGLDRIGDINDCGGRDKQLDPIVAQQNAMTVATLALQRLSPSASPADFSGLNFKCFKLHPLGDQLRGAVFQRANFWNADFYKMDLRGADFSDASAPAAKLQKAKLQDAHFNHADLEMAVFSDAALDNADFSGADLDGADLSQARGLTEAQLRAAAHIHCAKLPPALASVMAQNLIPPAGKRCP